MESDGSVLFGIVHKVCLGHEEHSRYATWLIWILSQGELTWKVAVPFEPCFNLGAAIFRS